MTGRDGHASVLCHGGISCDIKLSLNGFMPVAVTLTPQEVAQGSDLHFALSKTVADTQAVTVNADSTSPLGTC